MRLPISPLPHVTGLLKLSMVFHPLEFCGPVPVVVPVLYLDRRYQPGGLFATPERNSRGTSKTNRTQPGDIVRIGIHAGNALRGMEVGRMVRERGAWVVFGGIHATLYAEEARELGAAHVVVKGDGDVVD